MSQAMKQAQYFYRKAQEHGFSIEVASPSVIRIMKTFTVGDKTAFTECDIVAGDILANAPLKGGSIWGTDGGSIGGQVALNNGKFVMNKSGQGARFTKALSQLLTMFGS